jgi:hypothetical protein
MMTLKKLIWISLVSTLSSQALAQTTCEDELQGAVMGCYELMNKAESLQRSLEAQIGTQATLIENHKAEAAFYSSRLDDANRWYKQPSFVGPAASILTLLLVFNIKR